MPENVEDEVPEEEHNIEEPPIVGNIDNEDDLLYGDAPAFQMPTPSHTKSSEGIFKRTPWYI